MAVPSWPSGSARGMAAESVCGCTAAGSAPAGVRLQKRRNAFAHGFRLLHEKTGKNITLFYLHDRAIEANWRSFNKTFMEALGVGDQAVPPCMVFFRVHGEDIEDVAIYRIDEQATDPVLVAAELEQYVEDAIKRLNAEGDVSALSALGKLIAPIGALAKLGEFMLKLKGAA